MSRRVPLNSAEGRRLVNQGPAWREHPDYYREEPPEDDPRVYRVTMRLTVESDLSAREIEAVLREDGWPRLLGVAVQPSSVTAYEDVLIQERTA